jgi:trimeric autotransporter adhesin
VRSRIAIAVTVALGSAAWTMTAAAGNPHGTPPGQQQASGSTAVAASSNAHVPAKAQGKAQAKGSVAAAASVKAQGHAASSTKTTGSARAAVRSSVHASTASSATVQTATSAGVKPSSTTFHDTHELASSNKTKLYGNGQTAGQIAGSGNVMLHGPGNSQPHKVMCGPHEIDVHALKAHAAKCAAAAAAAGVAATVSSAVSPVAGQAPTATTPTSAAAGVKGARASAPAKQTPHAGVLGAKAQLASATKHVSRAILATAKGTLPFTGFGLALPILLGLALIAGGYGLRRRAAVLS